MSTDHAAEALAALEQSARDFGDEPVSAQWETGRAIVHALLAVHDAIRRQPSGSPAELLAGRLCEELSAIGGEIADSTEEIGKVRVELADIRSMMQKGRLT